MKLNKSNLTQYILALLIYFSIAITSLRDVIFTPGTIGFFDDWFIGTFPEMIKQYALNGLQLFDLNSGNKIYPTDWFFRVLSLPFAFLGGETLSKMLLVALITLAGISMFSLSKFTLKLRFVPCLFSGVFYALSPIIFTRVIAGHIDYIISLVIAPILLLTFFHSLKNPRHNLPSLILSGILFGLIGAQIQFLILMMFIFIIFAILNKNNYCNSLITLAIVIIIGVLIQAPVAFTIFSNPSGIASSVQYISTSYQEITNSPSLLESLRLLGYNSQPFSYQNLANSGSIPALILILDFAIPLLAATALIFRRNKYTIGFGLVLIIGIFFSKGESPPLGDLFLFLFNNTPLIIFREIWHFTFLPLISYAVLCSIALNEILQRYKKRWVKFSVIGLILIVLISNGYPMFLGNYAGYLQNYQFSQEYQNLYANYSDNASFRILWLPSIEPMIYGNNSLSGYDPTIRYSPEPTMPQNIVLQSPGSRLALFLTSAIFNNLTTNFGDVSAPYGYQTYIQRNFFWSEYYQYSLLSQYPEIYSHWNNTFTEQFLQQQTDLQLTDNTTEYEIYGNTLPSSTIYTPALNLCCTNDLSLLYNLALVTNLTNISFQTALNQLNPNGTIFVVKNDGSDLPTIITGYKIDPGLYATASNPSQGWIDGKTWFWYTYQMASTINDGIFCKGKGEISIPLNAEAPSQVWVRVLRSPNSGQMEIAINGNETQLNAFSLYSSEQWYQIPEEIMGSATLTISNINGENYIDEIAIMPNSQLNAATSYLNNSTIVYSIDATFTDNLVANPSFEQPVTQSDWSLPVDGFTMTQDDGNAFSGNNSIMVTTDLNSLNYWSYITSNEIPVSPGNYSIITHMKQENAEASHVAIEAYDNNSDTWSQIIQCPSAEYGTFDWRYYQTNFAIGENITEIRVVLNAGWVLNPSVGNATTWFDDMVVSRIGVSPNTLNLNANHTVSGQLNVLSDGYYRLAIGMQGSVELQIANYTFSSESDQSKIVELGNLFLNEGTYDFTITAQNDSIINSLWLYSNRGNASLSDLFNQATPAAKIINYVMNSPDSWTVNVSATAPFFISFAVPYDGGWKLSVNNQEYPSTPNFGYINGFMVNQTGNLSLQIYYAPQRWFNLGILVFGLTIVFSAVIIAYDYNRKRKNQVIS